MHNNNFDFLRILLAWLVIITHSYALTGLPEADWLFQVTNGQTQFSHLAVRGFFVISGYLITDSLFRSRSVFDYFKKRILRVFPALIVVNIVCALVIGYIVTDKNAASYFAHESVWQYIYKNSILNIVYTIDGVLDGKGINGSLWTISYEFLMYIILSLLFWVKNRRFLFTVIITGIILFLLYLRYSVLYYTFSVQFDFIPYYHLNRGWAIDLGLFFAMGSLLFVAQFHIINSVTLLFSSTFLLVLCFYFHIYEYTQYFVLPVLMISFGLLSFKYICSIRKFGDPSYGIYIWAFPIQQLLVWAFQFNYIELMVFASIYTFIIAYASWHFLEKWAMKLK